MGKKVISVELSARGINKALKDLAEYKEEFLVKEKRLLEGLASIGVREASIRFTTAIYDGVNDVSVSLDKRANGYVILAEGRAVAFIEFGTGVYHNPSEPYPNPRPEGIVGIGEYGKGRGKRRAWFYEGEQGSNGEPQKNGIVKTRGNPAAMPMWYASEEMKKSILTIVREVFG